MAAIGLKLKTELYWIKQSIVTGEVIADFSQFIQGKLLVTDFCISPPIGMKLNDLEKIYGDSDSFLPNILVSIFNDDICIVSLALYIIKSTLSESFFSLMFERTPKMFLIPVPTRRFRLRLNVIKELAYLQESKIMWAFEINVENPKLRITGITR
jgi:hypothetical protein